MGAEETWNQTNSIKIKVYSGGSWSSSSTTSIIILFFFLIIYLFCCARSLVGAGGILVGQMGFHSLTRDQTWGPLHWECRVLATGPPGKSRHQHSYLVSPSRKFKVKLNQESLYLFQGFLTFTKVKAASLVERAPRVFSTQFYIPVPRCSLCCF